MFLHSEIKFTQYFMNHTLCGDQIMLSKNDFGDHENDFTKPDLIVTGSNLILPLSINQIILCNHRMRNESQRFPWRT